jgi:NAD(P)-dependent dehydrogenase (short-subunit alcohol dehydrogenase family)
LWGGLHRPNGSFHPTFDEGGRFHRTNAGDVPSPAMADLGYDGKVAVITGAGGGLGREHALLLADRGAQVVVNDLGGSVQGGDEGNLGPAETVAKEINDAGGVAVADGNSVSTPEGGEGIIQTAVDAFGRVDIVINNAGILRDKTFHNMTPEFLDPVLDVHLRGAFFVTKPAWLKMREQGYGRIVNTSSNSGILGNFGQSNYGAAKMGLVGFTRVLAAEGAKYNIKVNALAPVARTRMTEELLGPLADKLDPKLVSPIVAWLVHEDCPVSGEIYSAAGGRIARFFIGLTEGYYNPKLTLEDVRDNFEQIRNEDGYMVPNGPGDEFGQLLEHFQS